MKVFSCPVHGWTLSAVSVLGSPWNVLTVGDLDVCSPCFYEAKAHGGTDFDAVSWATAHLIVFEAPPGSQVVACRSCEAPIYFQITKLGKRAPIAVRTGVSHFADCPASKAWNRKAAMPRTMARVANERPRRFQQ